MSSSHSMFYHRAAATLASISTFLYRSQNGALLFYLLQPSARQPHNFTSPYLACTAILGCKEPTQCSAPPTLHLHPQQWPPACTRCTSQSHLSLLPPCNPATVSELQGPGCPAQNWLETAPDDHRCFSLCCMCECVHAQVCGGWRSTPRAFRHDSSP